LHARQQGGDVLGNFSHGFAFAQTVHNVAFDGVNSVGVDRVVLKIKHGNQRQNNGINGQNRHPMKLKLRKSFRLIKLLNKNQPAVLRGPAAVVIAWYFRRGWINLDVSKDNYFDFTEDMTDAQLDVLEQFVTAAAPRLAPLKYHADMVFIAARRLDNDTDPAKRAVHARALHDASNLLLAQAQPASDTPQDKPRKGDLHRCIAGKTRPLNWRAIRFTAGRYSALRMQTGI